MTWENLSRTRLSIKQMKALAAGFKNKEGSKLAWKVPLFLKSFFYVLLVMLSLSANITGGGLADNIKRVIPNNFSAEINLEKIKTSKIFKWLHKNGISDNDSADYRIMTIKK